MDEKFNGYEQTCSDITSFNVSVLDEIRTKITTKLDSNFSREQFLLVAISSYSKPYRLDRNWSGGGVIYIGEDMPR